MFLLKKKQKVSPINLTNINIEDLQFDTILTAYYSRPCN
jgi:hypothetical protein